MSLFDRIESRGWLYRIHQEFQPKEVDELRKEYFEAGATKKFKTLTHTMICTRAISLAESVFVLEGTKEEVHLALEYLLICLDCEKYSLNWKKYRKDHDIRNLEIKYGVYADSYMA